MSSLNDQATIDEIVKSNGKGGFTHIIQYNNMFDGAITYKLCKNVNEYQYAMQSPALLNPVLYWRKSLRYFEG
jgi:cobalamin biosynthesis Co2+ chelatase CbiK